MLTIPPPRRVRRGRRETTAQSVLTLFSAVYSATPSPVLTLTFDRPVNIEKYNGANIEVDDGDAGKLYIGGAATLLGRAQVRIALVFATSITGAGVHLTASATSEIIAADDAGPWTGCTNLPLPYP